MLDIFFLFPLLSKAGIFGKFIFILLFFFSIFSWSVILLKFYQYIGVSYQIASFKKFLQTQKTIFDLFQVLNTSQRAIYFSLLSRCLLKFDDYKKKHSNSLSEEELGVFQRTATIQLVQIQKKYRTGLSFLAICSSSSPFIGLLGTVIGVTNTFKEISLQKATSLAVVAPGLSEALVATALGIFVAIPALIFYNYFNSRLRSLVEDLETITLEILNIFKSA